MEASVTIRNCSILSRSPEITGLSYALLMRDHSEHRITPGTLISWTHPRFPTFLHYKTALAAKSSRITAGL
jgi:hypothetical protein